MNKSDWQKSQNLDNEDMRILEKAVDYFKGKIVMVTDNPSKECLPCPN